MRPGASISDDATFNDYEHCQLICHHTFGESRTKCGLRGVEKRHTHDQNSEDYDEELSGTWSHVWGTEQTTKTTSH